MAKSKGNTQPATPTPADQPAGEQINAPISSDVPPVSGAETPPDTNPAPTPNDGTPVPPVAEAEEEEKAGRIKTSWFGDVCTWNIPNYDGEAPTLDTSKLNANIRNMAFRAGIQAKGVDGAAKKSGTPAADKAAFIKRVCGNLLAGKWKGDRGESFGDGILMAAYNEVYKEKTGEIKFPDIGVYQKFVTDGAAAAEITNDQFIARQEARLQLRPVVDRMRLASLADVKFDTDDFLDQ